MFLSARLKGPLATGLFSFKMYFFPKITSLFLLFFSGCVILTFTYSFSIQSFSLTGTWRTQSRHSISSASSSAHIRFSLFCAWLNKLMAQNCLLWAQTNNRCIKNSPCCGFAQGVISWLVFVQCFEDQGFLVCGCRYENALAILNTLLILISCLLPWCRLMLRAVTNQP